MNTLMNNTLRIAGCITGIVLLALTLGFVFQFPLAVNLWPWPDSRLSYLFLGSILAAVTVAVGWISLLGEWGALPAGALNVFVIAVTWAVYFLQRSFSDHHSSLLSYGLVGLLIALVSAIAFLWSRRLPLHDPRPTPRFLLFSFGLFAVILLLFGLFSSLKPEHRLSLILYVAVLLYSGLLAIYYLLLKKKTRGWQARSQSDEAAFTG